MNLDNSVIGISREQQQQNKLYRLPPLAWWALGEVIVYFCVEVSLHFVWIFVVYYYCTAFHMLNLFFNK